MTHTLDKQDGWMNLIWLFAKILAAELQTLAEKMSNTIYRAAKVCSYHISGADKLLIYHGDIHSFTYSSINLMYDVYVVSCYNKNDLNIKTINDY